MQRGAFFWGKAMTITADRLSGAFFLLFGLAMYFVVIPGYVEQTDGRNLAPSTMPNVVALVIAVCGGLLVLKPTTHQAPDARYFAISTAFVAILAGGIYAISWVGFEYVASPLALVIMLMIGERRPLWLLAGAAVMPAAIWFLVTQLLERALP